MRKLKYFTISTILVMVLSLIGSSSSVSAGPLAQLAPTLGAADSFSILAGAGISSVPTSAISGDVGISPGPGTAYSGLTAAEVLGTIYDVDGTGPAGSVMNPGLLTNAQAANTAAFGALIAGPNATCTNLAVGTFDLSGSNLVAGVYCAGDFTLTGTLTLQGTGIWIFQSGSTLVTSQTANVVGGDPCNVWWRVPSAATLGTNTQLTGNILALSGIQMGSGATLNGRALVQNPGSVTLNAATVSRGPLCTVAEEEEDVIRALPDTGGAPIRNEDFPWSLVVLGGFGAIALGLGVRAYRRSHLRKQ